MGSCGCGDRPSDKPADLLFKRIIRGRLAADEVWDWKADLEYLDEVADEVGQFGIGPWYPESREALREQISEDADR